MFIFIKKTTSYNYLNENNIFFKINYNFQLLYNNCIMIYNLINTDIVKNYYNHRLKNKFKVYNLYKLAKFNLLGYKKIKTYNYLCKQPNFKNIYIIKFKWLKCFNVGLNYKKLNYNLKMKNIKFLLLITFNFKNLIFLNFNYNDKLLIINKLNSNEFFIKINFKNNFQCNLLSTLNVLKKQKKLKNILKFKNIFINKFQIKFKNYNVFFNKKNNILFFNLYNNIVNSLNFYWNYLIIFKLNNLKCFNRRIIFKIIKNLKSKYKNKFFFFLNKILYFLWITLYYKDLSFFKNLLKILFIKNKIFVQKKIFFFIHKSILHCKQYFKILKVKGFFLSIRGKINSIGSIRKKYIYLRYNKTSLTQKNLKLEKSNFVLKTNTGVCSVNIKLFY